MSDETTERRIDPYLQPIQGGAIEPDESGCYLNSEPFKQCCCNCASHLEDCYHCTVNPEIREGTKSDCICSIRKGWICAGFADGGRAHSGWPEHAVGCEMYTPKRKTP